MRSERIVDIGGYNLCMEGAGTGSPTVVIDAGAGEGLNEWRNVLDAVSTFTHVCTYDRAGVGKSDRGPNPRTAQQKVSELHSLLFKANINGPYLLVGHSIGGLHMQVYASCFPDDVVGIVLADPSFSDMRARLTSVLGNRKASLLWNLQSATIGEGMTRQDFDNSFAQVTDPLPNVPLVIISAGQPIGLPPPLNFLLPGEKIMQAMQEGHSAIVKSSSQARHVIDKNSNHNTMRLHQTLIDGIREMVKALR